MPDDELRPAVQDFLDAADDAFGEYDNGYVDADATLRRLETHIRELREATEDG